MKPRTVLSFLSIISLTLVRAHILPRQSYACRSNEIFYCCACDPTEYDEDCGCFTDPCDPETPYNTPECCTVESDGSTDWSSCYNPNPPPVVPDPGNGCADGQNLECCEGDPNKDPSNQDGSPYCQLTKNSCDPNGDYFDAFCCNRYEDGSTDFFTCKSVPNNGAAPSNSSSTK